MSKIFDDTVCALGEGPLWHPKRQSFFWFDILNHTLFAREGGQRKSWVFDVPVSAAGWIDENHLLIASETCLFQFNLETEARDILCPFEPGNRVTRSNDGRADPYGGFWIGSMGKNAEKYAGSIHRYYRGEMRTLFTGITVANSICFSPDGLFLYYADTWSRRIMRQPLGKDGWPVGASEVHVDLRAQGYFPDGSVVDQQGNIWNAQWGAGRVAGYDANGRFIHEFAFDTPQTSCPAFGGEGLGTMIVTSAADGLERDESGHAGMTFVTQTSITGQAEHRVIL